MRLALFYNPMLLLERLGAAAERLRRRRKLKGTIAQGLQIGHIDSLELLELLRDEPPKIVYDIGAHVGTWTLLARAVFPSCEIHAFEPLDSHRSEFSSRIHGISGIHMHSVALGSSECEATMNVTGFSDSSSLLVPTEALSRDFGSHTVRHENVSVSKLDDYIIKNGLPWPDLIKLDVQGYEHFVLQGAPNCLSRVRALISEVSFEKYYNGQALFHELVHLCANSSLHIVAFGKGTVLGGRVKQTDALFLRRGPVSLRGQ